ncbi:hypothetical protein HK104_007320, partial [Borealophlyctis nickersoniae]
MNQVKEQVLCEKDMMMREMSRENVSKKMMRRLLEYCSVYKKLPGSMKNADNMSVDEMFDFYQQDSDAWNSIVMDYYPKKKCNYS